MHSKMKLKKWWFRISLFFLSSTPLYADAALLLQQPHSVLGSFNPTGHTAVYLSRVCAASPSQLRRCSPGETGVVISRYSRIGGYDWIAIPLMPYLYAVDQADQIPSSVDREGVASLRDGYRRKYLKELVPDTKEGQTPKGDWTQLVGAAYDRKIYGFVIETSEAADDWLIESLNARSNKRRYNLFYRNCADFSKGIINFYYPKAVGRSIIADAGITTPKQIAKSLVKFSNRRPDLQFYAFVIPQVQGSLKRSKAVRGVFESLIRSKKYALPLAIVYPWVAAGGLAAYVTGGRFNPEKHATMVLNPDELVERISGIRSESASAGESEESIEVASNPMLFISPGDGAPKIPEKPYTHSSVASE